MKKEEWGPCIWNLLHCITIKIKDDKFSEEKNNIIKIINNICNNLPCPMCAAHATQILIKYKFEKIDTKERLIKVIFFLHNEVNNSLKKKLYSYNNLIDKYSKYNFIDVLNKYYSIMNKSNYNEKMMLYSFHKKKFLVEYKKYFLNNIKQYEK